MHTTLYVTTWTLRRKYCCNEYVKPSICIRKLIIYKVRWTNNYSATCNSCIMMPSGSCETALERAHADDGDVSNICNRRRMFEADLLEKQISLRSLLHYWTRYVICCCTYTIFCIFLFTNTSVLTSNLKKAILFIYFNIQHQ